MDQETRKEFEDLTLIIRDSFGELESRMDGKFQDIESRMATKDDIHALNIRVDSIESRMATKDDLTRFATKDDLTRFATKDDLDGMETRMVSKAYLDDKLADLGAEIGARINRRVERDQGFKRELLNLLKRHALIEMNEIEQLEAFI